MPSDTTLPPSPATNTARTYGSVTKTFHWLTALLILTAIPLGAIANRLPYETAEQLAVKAQLFSIHKTVGVAAFLVALARILWAVTQTKPSPVHPDRKAETLLAETVHWTLYAALVVVPLSGWIHHAASQGFAPILWPFGQSLPLVPQSDLLFEVTGTIHWVFTKILLAAVILHIAGALKHAFVDRDTTLSRMWFTRTDTSRIDPGAIHSHGPAIFAAAIIYVAGFAASFALTTPPDEAQEAPSLAAAEGGNWAVQDGTLGLTIVNFGSEVTGSFSDWTARIAFSETAGDDIHGEVAVQVAIPSITLGSVTTQALGPDFFNADAHPTATYNAHIKPAETGYVAEGTLDLAGQSVPVSLPFTLEIDGDIATMSGSVTVQRLDFGIGTTYPDESALGFDVVIDVALTAIRQEK